jgi:TatD DNase family protein
MSIWIDSHCHLDAIEFDADRLAVVQRARLAGVTQLVLPAVARSNFDTVRHLAHEHKALYALGIHPLYVGQALETDLQHLHEQLQQHSRDPRLVAVGEIGIDAWIQTPDLVRQTRFYAAQLQLAREFDLPVILHVRKSADLLLKQLRAQPVCGGIAHAFNGSLQQAMAFVEMNFKLGFGGAMTFERALQIRRLAQELPLRAIVLETDAPDIPPHWLYRTAAERSTGATSRNEPGELPRIGAVLAQLRNLSIEEVAACTTQNMRNILECGPAF